MSSPRVDIIDPLSNEDLAPWLEATAQSTIFHSVNWARVMAESYGFQPVCLVLSQGGRIRACLPVMEVKSTVTGSRGVCLSFSDYCCAIVEDGEEFRLLFNTLLEYGRVRKWRYLEFRGEPFLSGRTPCSIYAHHIIRLSTDEQFMLSRLRKSTARSIQKAVKEGVTVRMSDTMDGVMEYYDLHCLTRRRQGLPPQPKSYFIKLHEHVIAQGLGFTALARKQGVTMAGIICLHFGKNAIYKYGASDPDYQHLRANNLLFWEIIRKYGQDGFRYLSLGRTDLDNPGLVLFKDGWGGEQSCLNYYRYDLTSDKFIPSGQADVSRYTGILKKMPVGVLKILGRMAYRHFG